MFHGSIADRLVLTEILLSPGGEKLSPEAAQIIAVLRMTLPDPHLCYHQSGTREFDRNSPDAEIREKALRKSLNHCHTVNQVLIRENDKLQRRLSRQWVWIRVLMGATAGAWALVVGLIMFIVAGR